ncbi:MAG TPA: universal stress protein [Verrucomicrobiae bacterium]
MKAKQTPTTRAASPSSSVPTSTQQSAAGQAGSAPLRILVPVDFSKPAAYTLQAAGDFASKYGGRITLVTVIEPDPFKRFEMHVLAVRNETLERRVKSDLQKLGRELVGDQHIESVLVRSGKPFTEIVKAARKLETDLIIMATHGHTGLKHLLLGSTAERVIRYSPCAVLTVRGEGKRGWPMG